MKKRFALIGAILVAAMLCALIPLTALADTPETSVITAVVGEGGSITVSDTTGEIEPIDGTYSVRGGEEVTITATPDAGYVLDGESALIILEDKTEFTDGVLVFTAEEETYALNVAFNKITYAVTKTVNGEAYGKIDGPDFVEYGDEEGNAFTVSPAEGYLLKSLTLTTPDGQETDVTKDVTDGKYTIKNITDTTSMSITLSAEFVPAKYAIQVSCDVGGKYTCPKTADYLGEFTITLQPDEGYETASLFVNGASVDFTDDSYTVTGVDQVYQISVTFRLKSYAVSASFDDTCGSATAASETVQHGSDAVFTITPNEGYEVAGITVGEDKTNRKSEMVGNTFTVAGVTEDTSISVTFTKIQLAVTKTAQNGTIEGENSVLYGESKTYAITPATGYQFVKLEVITEDGTETVTTLTEGKYTLANVTKNTELKATFELKEYDITTSTDANGKITDSFKAKHFETPTVTVTPNTGNEVATFTVDGENAKDKLNNGVYTFEAISDNHTVAVTYKLKEYAITTSTDANGKITDSFTAKHFETPTITVTPNTGYEVATFTVDGENAKDKLNNGVYTFDEISSGHTVAVTYKLKEYDITTSTDGNGKITDSFKAKHFETPTVTVTPNTGYEVATFTVDGENAKDKLNNGVYTFDEISGGHTVAVTYKLKEYDITTSSDANGKITDSFTAKHFETPTVTVTPNTGYEVANFTVDGEDAKSNLNNGVYMFDEISGGHTVAVTYKLKEYDITTSTDANGKITDSFKAKHFETPTVTVTPNTGYEVATFTVDGENAKDKLNNGVYTFDEISGGHTVAVTYKLKEYDITTSTDANGKITDSFTAKHFEKPTVTVTPNTGYEVATFTVDGENAKDKLNNGVYTFDEISGSHTVAVTYKLKEYDITTSTDANGKITDSFKAKHFETPTVTVTPNTGYEVATFTVDGENAKDKLNNGGYTFDEISGSHTVAVTYKLKEYTITTSTDSHGAITPSFTAKHFTKVIIEVKPDTGYEVATFVVNGEKPKLTDGKYVIESLDKAYNISVTYKLRQYQISTEASANGSISPTFFTEHFTKPVITITPDEGYEIATFTVDGVDKKSEVKDNTYTFGSIDNKHSVKVTFSKIKFTIESTISANGSVKPGNLITVEYGDNQTITVEPSLGYEVSEFKVDGKDALLTGGTRYTFTNIRDNHTVTAVFSRIKYNIGISVGSNGTVTRNGSPVGSELDIFYGDSETFTITPAEGYTVDTFKVDGHDTSLTNGKYTFTNVKGSHTLSVTFKRIVCTVTASAGQYGRIDPNGVSKKFYGETITYTIEPLDGYMIDTFKIDGKLSTVRNNTYTFENLKTDHTIDVTFKRIPGSEYVLAREIISGHQYVIVSNDYALTNNDGKIGAEEVFVSMDGSYIIVPEGAFNALWMISDTIGNLDVEDEYYVPNDKYTISSGSYYFSSSADALLSRFPTHITDKPKNAAYLGYPMYEWTYDLESKVLSQKCLGSNFNVYYDSEYGFATIGKDLADENCKVRIYETGIPAAHVHIEVANNDVDPTCTEPGYCGGTHCGICGMEMQERTILQPAGHTWNEGVITRYPTKYMPGERRYTCTKCGAEKIENVPFTMPFTDVPESAWYYKYVLYAYQNNLVSGVTETTFDPNGRLTRAMFTLFLYNMEGKPELPMQHPFTDVPAGIWYAKAVNWAYSNKLVSGVTTTTFDPNADMTREQMATLLYRYAVFKGYDVSARADLSVFKDANNVSNFAVTAFQWANAEGIIKGVGDDTLNPKGAADRSQLATLMYNFIEKFANKN